MVDQADVFDRELKQKLFRAMEKGGKIEAIRVYRQTTKCDLKTAKEKVEEFAKKYPNSPNN